jgi:hypothetical protein
MSGITEAGICSAGGVSKDQGAENSPCKNTEPENFKVPKSSDNISIFNITPLVMNMIFLMHKWQPKKQTFVQQLS